MVNLSVNPTENKAVKAGLGYTIGNVLIKGINFISIPIFSRLLSTEEFGIYNVFISYETILFTLIGLAIHTSIRSAKVKFQDKIDEYTSSVILIYFINLLLCFILAIFFGETLSRMLDLEKIYIFLLIVYAFSSAIIYLYNNRISLDYSYKKYLLISLLSTIGNILISLILIHFVFSAKKDLGRVVGATISIVVICIGIIINLFKKSYPRYKKTYWSFALHYSIPIVPHSISQVLLAQFDRIMIKLLVSNSAADIFSLAANIKLILTIITDSITTAWSTWFYEKMGNDSINEIKKRAKQLLILFSVLCIGLISISPELVLILGGKQYDLAKYIAIPMVIDAFILFIYNIIVQAEFYKNKTLYIMYGTVGVAILNAIITYFFIKKYGFIAAAYTTLFSYFCYLCVHLFISRKVIGFYIISLKDITISMLMVVIIAIFDLLYIYNIFLRWGLCLIVIIILGIILISNNYYVFRRKK